MRCAWCDATKRTSWHYCDEGNAHKSLASARDQSYGERNESEKKKKKRPIPVSKFISTAFNGIRKTPPDRAKKKNGGMKANKKTECKKKKNTIHPSLRYTATEWVFVCIILCIFLRRFSYLLVFSSYLKLILRMKYIMLLVHMRCAWSPKHNHFIRVSHGTTA